MLDPYPKISKFYTTHKSRTKSNIGKFAKRLAPLQTSASHGRWELKLLNSSCFYCAA